MEREALESLFPDEYHAESPDEVIWLQMFFYELCSHLQG